MKRDYRFLLFICLCCCLVGCNSPQLGKYNAPDSWIQYDMKGAFLFSVPPTVELRHDYDVYTIGLQQNLLFYDNADVIFQQKGLSDLKSDAFNNYCRIMIQYIPGDNGDFLRHNQTEPIDDNWRAVLDAIVEQNVASMPGHTYELLEVPQYRWVDIDGTKAIEISYRRTADKGYTTACKIYLLMNYNEAVQFILSYREQAAYLWEKDFPNVIRTFEWKNKKYTNEGLGINHRMPVFYKILEMGCQK